jgi:hypothetical protein
MGEKSEKARAIAKFMSPFNVTIVMWCTSDYKQATVYDSVMGMGWVSIWSQGLLGKS